ncbi:hypothetical protein FB451DRAFT_1400797 [Mycena latifolia]|nr:hypothetical protein FB451DRAFT_1400797 [Mycena latifolia]
MVRDASRTRWGAAFLAQSCVMTALLGVSGMPSCPGLGIIAGEYECEQSARWCAKLDAAGGAVRSALVRSSIVRTTGLSAFPASNSASSACASLLAFSVRLSSRAARPVLVRHARLRSCGNADTPASLARDSPRSLRSSYAIHAQAALAWSHARGMVVAPSFLDQACSSSPILCYKLGRRIVLPAVVLAANGFSAPLDLSTSDPSTDSTSAPAPVPVPGAGDGVSPPASKPTPADLAYVHLPHPISQCN